MKDNLKHGSGIILFENGKIYEGTFQNNSYLGNGYLLS